jgi:restriction endonuclease S subunit
MIDDLLETANKTNLKIIIILLPPSEGGPDTSYDWKGWIKYFNSLEKKYPRSFEGFTIDDFNWISTRTDTKFKNNVDFMEYSGLSELLKDKSKDVKFYPTVYFEGRKTGIVVKKYDNFIDGLIVASGCYYNVSTLERQLHIFSEIFKKPIRYIVYPTITYNYSKLDYSPPSDRLIMATLSIASNSSDGLIIWRDLDNPVIQEHMNNRHDKQYLSDISNSKEKQISDENIDSNSKLSETKNVHNTCNGWSKKYNEAYDMWIKLPAQKYHDDWKKKILY